MKKLMSALLVILFVVGLAACDQGYLGDDSPTVAATSANTTDDSVTNTVTTEELTTEVPTTFSGVNADVQAIVQILNANSYMLTVHDASSIAYFTTNTLVNNYGIDVTVTDLIMGDVSGSDWIQLVGFASEADAIAYANALDTLDGGELYYREGTAVLLTYSQTALNLFV